MRILLLCCVILSPLCCFSFGYIVEKPFCIEGIGYLEQTANLQWILVLPSSTSTGSKQAFYLDNVVFSEKSVSYSYSGYTYFSNITNSYGHQVLTPGLFVFESSH